MLAIIETHPVQYRAPVYRMLQQQFGIPLTVIYGSDYSVAGYRDQEFNSAFAWDIDLVSGYSSKFLSQVQTGGARSFEAISSQGLGKALQEVAPDVVLITGYQHRLYQAAFYQALKQNYPILFRAETTDHALARNPLKIWLRDTTLHWAYQRCAKLLYIGQHSKKHHQRLGGTEQQLISSPYCVDTSPFQLDEAARIEFRELTRQSLGIANTQIVLIFSGKLSPRKRPDLILQAIKQLPSALREQITVLFMGNGELKLDLQSQAASAPSVTTHFVGFQNQTQLSRYYHAADLLILPSQYSETWGLVVNEGLHHGLPAIVSQAVGCAPDLVSPGITGEVFETGSAQSLAQAIERSVSLINRPETRQQCHDRVSHYTVEQAAQGIAAAYSHVAVEERKNNVRTVLSKDNKR
ncbi:glycosyltransferase family 4 protein [Egbenema bharatensis]|uniref:glycosyltransferase family 4 protein n=1 Tax=Egbenema bharatensis TaxID=3463334 RepID=UPI003A865C77